MSKCCYECAMKSRLILVLSILGSACASETASPSEGASTSGSERSEGSEADPSSGDTTFRFAWPDGMRAQVRCERNVSRGGATVGEVSTSWTLQVEQSEQGARIQTGDLTLSPIDTSMPDNDLVMALMAVETYLPPIEVDAEGQIRSLIDPAGTQATLVQAVEAAVPVETRNSPNWPVLEQSTGEAAQQQLAVNTWRTLVSTLAGQTLPTGEWLRAESPVLMAGGEQNLGADARVSEPVPCIDGDAESRCVRAELHSDAPADVITAANEQAAAQGSPVQLQSLVFDGAVVLEPDTLRPHTYDMVKRMAMTAQGHSLEEVQTRHCVFDYAN